MSSYKPFIVALCLVAIPLLVFANPDTMQVNVTVSEINELNMPATLNLDLSGSSAGSQPVSDVDSGTYSVTINDSSPSNIKKITVAAEPSDVDEFQFANITLLVNMEVPPGSGGSSIVDVDVTSTAAEGWVPQDVVIGIDNTTASSTPTVSVTAQGPQSGTEVPLPGVYEMTLTFQIVDE